LTYTRAFLPPTVAKLSTLKNSPVFLAHPVYGCPEFLGLPDYAHGYYSQHFSWYFVSIDPMNVPTKFEVRSFTRS